MWQGGMHGWGCMVGECEAGVACMGKGACVVGGICGWGACMVEACMAGGMHGRVCVCGKGHAWWGACMAGGMHG